MDAFKTQPNYNSHGDEYFFKRKAQVFLFSNILIIEF